MLVTRNQGFLQSDAIREAAHAPGAGTDGLRLWTDDYTSPFSAIRVDYDDVAHHNAATKQHSRSYASS